MLVGEQLTDLLSLFSNYAVQGRKDRKIPLPLTQIVMSLLPPPTLPAAAPTPFKH